MVGVRQAAVAAAVALLVATGAAALRLHDLGSRPFHVDEAVQAVKACELHDHGDYRYDPREFHGPSLYYFTLPVWKVAGISDSSAATEADFRLVTVVFGVMLVVVPWLVVRDLGWLAVLTAAVLTAVSPAMVYYSRYFIQETLLVVFAGVALVAGWKWWCGKRGWLWCAVCGVMLGLMYATKETSVIYFAAMACAAATLAWTSGRSGGEGKKPDRRMVGQAGLAVGLGLLVAAAFYSSFLRHPGGLLDSWSAFGTYLDRSGGEGSAGNHQHPWWYYGKLLVFTKNGPGPWWSEAAVLLLGCAGMAATALGRLPASVNRRLAVALAVYTVVLSVAFSVIPYKTPWNLLGPWHGWMLLAGIGFAAVMHGVRSRVWQGLPVVSLAAAAWHLAWQAERASGRFGADPRNPYAYVHSLPDVVRLARRVHEIVAVADPQTAVHVASSEYWPLPFYLRDMERVGYWSEIPEITAAPVMIVDAEWFERIEPLLAERYQAEYFGLRPGVLLLLLTRQDLWDRYLAVKIGAGDEKAARSGQ